MDDNDRNGSSSLDTNKLLRKLTQNLDDDQ